MKKIHLDEKDFHCMLAKLCNEILFIRSEFDWVVGIERGGLPISNWLAYSLGKRHTSIKVSRYGDNNVAWDPPTVDLTNLPKEQFLLVDDIVDSGTTVRIIEIEGKIIQGRDFKLATLHWCPEESPDCEPDFYVETKKKNEWIIYPWEKE